MDHPLADSSFGRDAASTKYISTLVMLLLIFTIISISLSEDIHRDSYTTALASTEVVFLTLLVFDSNKSLSLRCNTLCSTLIILWFYSKKPGPRMASMLRVLSKRIQPKTFSPRRKPQQ